MFRIKGKTDPEEAQLLRYLMANKNVILKRDDILKEIWGEDDYFLGRSMDVSL
ncbi:MAG: winged helix-turn-helix domain-containing protein [Bacteroidales bacterium]